MWKKLTPIMLALALAGCASWATLSKEDLVLKVQKATAAYCGFVPTAQTVLKILATAKLIPPLDYLAISARICAEIEIVAKQPVAVGRRAVLLKRPTYNGVVIHGTFVRTGRKI